MNHLICGDFNPTEWIEDYASWLHLEGAWELSDPALPTSEQGSALNKLILLPGRGIPESFLQPSFCSIGGRRHQDIEVQNPAAPTRHRLLLIITWGH